MLMHFLLAADLEESHPIKTARGEKRVKSKNVYMHIRGKMTTLVHNKILNCFACF